MKMIRNIGSYLTVKAMKVKEYFETKAITKEENGFTILEKLAIGIVSLLLIIGVYKFFQPKIDQLMDWAWQTLKAGIGWS